MTEQLQVNPVPNSARRLRYLLLYLLMAWALISIGFRFVLKDVSQYQAEIENLVLQKTDFQLEIGQMSGRWLIVSPVIELRDINLKGKALDESQQGYGVHVEHLAVELDLIESLFTFSPRVKRILLDGVKSNLLFDEKGGKLLIDGLPLKANEQKKDNLEQIKNILESYILTAEKIYVRNVKFDLDAGEYGVYQLELPSLSLDNEWFSHQLETRLLIATGQEKPRKVDFISVFQGSPLELESFSARNFLSIERNDLGYLFDHALWPKNDLIQPKNARLSLKTWVEVNNGDFESIKLDFSIKDVFFLYQNENEKSDNVLKGSSAPSNYEEVQIDELAFKMELKSKVPLNTFLTKETRDDFVKSVSSAPFKMKLKDFELVWGDFQWRSLAILFEQGRAKNLDYPLARKWSEFYVEESKNNGYEESKHFSRLLINRIPMALVSKIIPYIPMEEDKKEKIISASPEGFLHNLQVFAYEASKESRELYASAHVKDLGITAFDKLPGVHGVDFYVELAPKTLGIELQTSDALLEENFYLFRDDLRIDLLSANIFLEMIPGDIVIASDVASLKANNLMAQGYFKANIPDRVYPSGEKEQPAWSLQAHIQPTALDDIKMFFLGKLSPSLLDWIDDFLVKGRAEGDIFLFAFLKRQDPYTFATLDANIDVHHASLDYLPGRWPQIDEVEANVLVHNDRIKAKVLSGKMFDSRLFNGNVDIESYLAENLPRVQVTAQSSGKLEDVQKLFLQSELKQTLGHVVEDWVLTGNQQSDVKLDFPLSDSPQQKKELVEVNLKTEDALLAIPDVRLGVRSLSTDLNYSLENGLSAQRLTGLFFDKPIEGKIETRESAGEQVFQISGKGQLSADDLKSWQSFWLFENLSGVADFSATISIGDLVAVNTFVPEVGMPLSPINNSPPSLSVGDYQGKESIVRVEVKTDLKNTAIKLPGSYSKDTKISMPSTLQLDVFPDWLVYRMNYGKRVGVVTKTIGDSGDFDRARIHFGEGYYPLPRDSGLIVTGKIDHVDFDEWIDYIEKNLLEDELDSSGQTNTISKKDDDPAAIINRIDVVIERFTGFDQELENLKAFITRESFKWRVDLENAVLKGIVLVPDEELISKENPIVAKLDYLKISEEQLAGIEYQEIEVKDNSGKGVRNERVAVKKTSTPYVPDDFMFAQIDIATMTLGTSKNGRWRIDLIPDEKGMDFNVHQLNYGLMTINGTGRWNYSEERSVTHFKGHLRTAAATKVFSALNLKPSSKSTGLMTIDLKWPGSPMDFDYDAMTGKAGLEIFDGSIVEIDIKSKKFKALGIFNLGIVTDILTLKIFKKIGKGIDEALSGEAEEKKEK